MVGVIAHDVSLIDHALDNVRGGLDHMAHHEERGGGVVLFQSVQNGLGVAVFIAAVKGQVNDFFAGIPQIVGAVLGQIFRGGVAHRGCAFLRKGQPPVVGGGRHHSGGGSRGGWSRAVLQEQGSRQEQTGQQQ